MRLNTVERPIERSGIDNETSFTIKQDGKMFFLLSSGIYSNKIGTIVRELSCNAYDAHIQAGKKDVPFEIHTPTQMEPWFIIRDFGPGLSHEDVIGIYSTYFASTKSDSNEYVGAFGLGSKSPFCYTETFMINSIHNGMKRCYVALITEDGTPKISLMNDDDTTEESGLEVHVSVKSSDYTDFKTNIEYFLQYFPVQPTMNLANYTWKLPEYSVKNDDYGLVNSENGRYKLTIIQGNVPYPFNESASSKIVLPQHIKDMINYLPMNLFFNIGELSVAVSREALSYDSVTVERLLAKLEVVYQDLRKQFQALLLQSKVSGSLWKTILSHKEMKNNNYELYNLFSKEFGHPASKTIVFKKDELKSVVSGFKEQGKKTKSLAFPDMNVLEYNLNPSENTKVIVSDVDVPITWIQNHINSTSSMAWQNSTLIVLYPQLEMKDKIQDIIDYLGNPDYTLTSAMAKPPSKTYIRNRYSEVKYVTCSEPYVDDFGTEELPTEGYYLILSRDNVMQDKTNILHKRVYQFLPLVKELKLFDSEKEIFVLTPAKYEKYVNKTNWKPFLEVLKENTKKEFDKQLETNFKASEYEKNTVSSYELNFRNEVLKRFKEAGVLNDFVEYANLFTEYSKAKKNTKLLAMTNLLTITDNSTPNLKSLTEEKSKIDLKYPMMRLMNLSWDTYSNKEKVQHVVDYINIIDKAQG